jgi:hypothetical protein
MRNLSYIEDRLQLLYIATDCQKCFAEISTIGSGACARVGEKALQIVVSYLAYMTVAQGIPLWTH